MLQNTIEKFFLTRNGDTGFKNGRMNRRDTKDFMTFDYNAYPDSILQKFSNVIRDPSGSVSAII